MNECDPPTRLFIKFFDLSFRNSLSLSLTGEITMRNDSSKKFCPAQMALIDLVTLPSHFVASPSRE